MMNEQEKKRILDQFDQDGSLRDIYIFDADASVWTKLAQRLLDSAFDCKLRVGETLTDDVSALPGVFADPDAYGSLLVTVANAEIRSHLFTSDDIEFDLEPGQWSSANIASLADFTRFLSDATSRNVFVTHENSPEHCIFATRHGVDFILLPSRPKKTTTLGQSFTSRLSDILKPFAQDVRDVYAEVPTTVAAQASAKMQAEMDRPNDIEWHTELTAGEFRRLRELTNAFGIFFGWRTPEDLCRVGDFRIGQLRRQFWEAVEATRNEFGISG